ncbi:MAG: VOC family protein [Hyphomicrobiaceae bacterium]|nr:VOC family protein [Hyphomicrobiaceae bacterium]
MKMTAPVEIGICCDDLDSLRAFYVDVLGCEPVNEHQVTAEKSTPAGMAKDGYRVARLQTSWGERLKLIQPATTAEGAVPAEWILGRRGIAYITFIIDDLSAMIARLKAAGVTFVTGEERVEVRPGTFLSFIRDPEGNVLEFVEYSDIREYRPDLA